MTKQVIINKINSFIESYSDSKRNLFYIGITSDIETRLFSAHKVEKSTEEYVSFRADSEKTAREIEKEFLMSGLDGDTGGGTGDGDVDIVYCFRKMFYTDPKA